MTWLKVDDKITTHPKWLPLTLEAKSLWFHGLVWCGAHNNDGHLPEEAMPFIAFSASVPAHLLDDAAARLVKARLWKRRAKRDGGGYEIAGFLEYQPSKQQVRERQASDELADEMRALHDWLHKKAPGKRVKKLILSRDGDRCRYCGEAVRVTPGDRRSPHRRTFDLIDPAARWDVDASALHDTELQKIADLWVVACGWCNSIKGKRTPDEAGIELLPPPRLTRGNVLPRSAANGSGAVPPVGPGLPGSGQDRTERAGPGRDGSGSESTEGARGDEYPPPPDEPPDEGDFPGEGER